MVIKILDNENVDKVKNFLLENNIAFEEDSAYIISLKEDIIDAWYDNHCEEPPEEIIKQVLAEMMNDDCAYEEYDNRMYDYMEKAEEEYYQE